MQYVCWAELAYIQLLTPHASFLGHLGGILAGLVHVYALEGRGASFLRWPSGWWRPPRSFPGGAWPYAGQPRFASASGGLNGEVHHRPGSARTAEEVRAAWARREVASARQQVHSLCR